MAVDLLAYGIAAFAGWKASTSAHPERVRRNWMIWSVVLLLVFLGWNLAEAWDRWRNPAATAGLGTFIIALAGAVGNLIQHRIVIAGEDNHTTRGLALHTLEDLISSVAVMASGVLVAFTEQSAWDPIATGIVCLWLAYRAGCRLIDSGHHHH